MSKIQFPVDNLQNFLEIKIKLKIVLIYIFMEI